MKRSLDVFKKSFIFISIIFILFLIIIYSYRLIHFYRLENIEDPNSITNYFSDKLEKTINVTDASGGLYIIEDEYIYKYDAKENYLWYSGQLWRILKINKDKTMDIIAEDSISLLNVKFENTNYIESYLNDFYNNLDKEFLTELEYCSDPFNDVNDIKCQNKTKSNITLLDIYTYHKAGGNSSFLNNNSNYWLINKTSEENNWYINKGSLSISEDINSFDIRPVVRIKNKIDLISGEGTKENPYIIKNNTNLNIGEYVKFNNDLWRITLLTNGITISKNDCIKENNECILMNFGDTNIYNESLLYNYLNTTYYNSIINKDYIINSTFEIGDYVNYNYKNTSLKTMNSYIGIPKISDYYISNKINTYLLTTNDSEAIYSINENNNYYLTFTSEMMNVYPVLTLDKDLKILNGNGTYISPYELGR